MAESSDHASMKAITCCDKQEFHDRRVLDQKCVVKEKQILRTFTENSLKLLGNSQLNCVLSVRSRSRILGGQQFHQSWKNENHDFRCSTAHPCFFWLWRRWTFVLQDFCFFVSGAYPRTKDFVPFFFILSIMKSQTTTNAQKEKEKISTTKSGWPMYQKLSIVAKNFRWHFCCLKTRNLL